jgi:hypothetical protein
VKGDFERKVLEKVSFEARGDGLGEEEEFGGGDEAEEGSEELVSSGRRELGEVCEKNVGRGGTFV